MALRARNAPPWLLATLNPKSTCHRPRPGPTLAPWISGGLPACPRVERTRKDPRPEEKTLPMCKKTHLYIRIIYVPFCSFVTLCNCYSPKDKTLRLVKGQKKKAKAPKTGDGRIHPWAIDIVGEHLCCIAHKKKKGRFCGQVHNWKHLYLRFCYVRRSAIPPELHAHL